MLQNCFSCDSLLPAIVRHGFPLMHSCSPSSRRGAVAMKGTTTAQRCGWTWSVLLLSGLCCQRGNRGVQAFVAAPLPSPRRLRAPRAPAVSSPPSLPSGIRNLPNRAANRAAKQQQRHRLHVHWGNAPPPPPLHRAAAPHTHHHLFAMTSVTGKLWPFVSRLLHLFTPSKLRGAAAILRQHIQPQDWIFVAVLLVAAYSKWDTRGSTKTHTSTNDDTEKRAKRLSRLLSRAASSHSEPLRKALHKLWLINSFRSLARVALSAYIVDIVCLILRWQGGFHFPHLWDVPRVYAKAAFSIWTLRRFLEWKRPLVIRLLVSSGGGGAGPSGSGRADLVDKALNGISIGLVALAVSDWLSVELGLALTGAVALGSAGTLAFTLASKDLVSQLVSGVFLQATDKMTPGDNVQLGEGSSGKVVRIGWTETILRGSDNTITSIPNAKLVNDKVINFSRVPVSQVKQVLRFHYRDIDALPDVLQSIKSEVQASCPQLIVDGSRPFRVFFTDYGERSLQVLVDAHFRIPPTSDEYWSNRQEVLLAIHRAVKAHRIPYAYANDHRDYSNNYDEREWGGLPPLQLPLQPSPQRQQLPSPQDPIDGAGADNAMASASANSTASSS